MSEAASVNLRARVARFRPSRLLVLDLFTSYGVNLARAAAMLAIVALLGHRTTTGYLAAFLFLRAMIGLLNNLFAGVQPAALAALSLDPPESLAPSQEIAAPPTSLLPDLADTRPTLDYESSVGPRTVVVRPTAEWSALLFASLLPAIALIIVLVWLSPLLTAAAAPLIPQSRTHLIAAFSFTFTAGLLARLASDTAGGALQLRNFLWLDNLLVGGAEILWVFLALKGSTTNWAQTFEQIGESYLVSGAILFMLRWLFAAGLLVDSRTRRRTGFRFDVSARFLSVASILAVASLGDFLYAPANYLIINRLLDPILIASYGPALQVDALLLLGVSGIASVLLPRVVALHQRGDFAALRHAYLAAHIVGTLLLLGGAGLFLAFSRPLLNLWLGDVPPGTRAILPFVLIHTVVGGTASIGRSVLLGVGRFRAWTVASLAGGIANVVLGLLFVVVCGWGLRGIVAATIITVTLRNAIWLPWFVLRQLRPPQPL